MDHYLPSPTCCIYTTLGLWALGPFNTPSSKGRSLHIYSDHGEQAIQQGDSEIKEAWFDQADKYEQFQQNLSISYFTTFNSMYSSIHKVH